MPAFYNHPETVDDIVHHVVARVLDQFGLEHPMPGVALARIAAARNFLRRMNNGI